MSEKVCDIRTLSVMYVATQQSNKSVETPRQSAGDHMHRPTPRQYRFPRNSSISQLPNLHHTLARQQVMVPTAGLTLADIAREEYSAKKPSNFLYSSLSKLSSTRLIKPLSQRMGKHSYQQVGGVIDGVIGRCGCSERF